MVSSIKKQSTRVYPAGSYPRAAFVLLAALAFLFAASTARAQAPTKPEQVVVSVKIIEFQLTKGIDTGLSAFFQKLPRAQPFGMVSVPGTAINMADLTFPISSAAGITVFLDRIRLSDGDIELVLQGLVDENRAFILSKPRAHVMIGQSVWTEVKTVQEVPYENTVVVGNTTQQVTAFEETGVSLRVRAPQIIDDDGDWSTSEDTYVQLQVNAEVKEEGQRIVVSLDDQLTGGDFTLARNAIRVPEFISRSINTHVWVRDGQVLILGGLFRNSDTKSLSTLPWLSQAEDFAVATAERLVPGDFLSSPLSSTFGNRSTNRTRALYQFMKAEMPSDITR